MDKANVIKAIRRENPDRVPIWYSYIADETYEKYGEQLQDLLREFPNDMAMCFMQDHPWGSQELHAAGGVGSQVHTAYLDDWEHLDAFFDPEKDRSHLFPVHFPKAESGSVMEPAKRVKAEHPDEFAFGAWWRLYFERLHYLRTMEEAFVDILAEQENVEKLFEHLEVYYRGLVDRFISEVGVDGIFFGDDLGMQDRAMMSVDTFRTVLKPFYRRTFDYIHSKGLFVAFHTCGNVMSLIPELIDIGLDVIHPIQPYAMDAERTVNEYGKYISFMAGVDIQHLLPMGTPKTIDAGIRDQFRLFGKYKGFLAGFANTIMPETPFENIRAAFEAMRRYAAY